MPCDSEHLALAAHNQDLINHLIPSLDRFADWVTVVAFYKAVHIVEAVFFKSHPEKHGRNHENREYLLKATNHYQQIYRFYRPLWSASTVARYLEDHTTRTEYGSFAEYMTPAIVQSRILGHYLVQLEKAAERFLLPKK